jgi:hypothetical protein
MKELRWLADYVVEFSNMSDSAKEIAFDFINEADEAQLVKLIVDGEMVLEVKKKEIPTLKEQFDSTFKPLLTEGEIRQARKATMSIVGAGGLRLAMDLLHGRSPLGALQLFGYWAVYRAIRAGADECSRKCGAFHLNLPKRQSCLQKCEYQKDQALEKLKKYKNVKKK